ncbi:MAG TPA: glucosidase, partial [Clostridia bacterium]
GLWNGSDPCIKERLYGLTNSEGNHGEDVKEYYFYADNTPTHSYMKYVYKYPYYYNYGSIYNSKDSISPFEFELANTGAFNQGRYFDIVVEYAKNDVEDILIKITAKNYGPETKTLHLLPTTLFRNTWSFNKSDYQKSMTKIDKANGCIEIVQTNSSNASKIWLYCDEGSKEMLFTENNTDNYSAFGCSNEGNRYFKNGINNYIINKYLGNKSEAEVSEYVNPEERGTKSAVHYEISLNPGESRSICLRLSNVDTGSPFVDFDSIFKKRKDEADEFYDSICPYSRNGTDKERDLYNIQRQAFAGMLWNKQLYSLVVEKWLNGDDLQPRPSNMHQNDEKMNKWKHMYSNDILSMPDKCEYPWFAAWDMAFHAVTFSIIDPEFAKHQLLLLCMEWFMHPNGQIPAYEWDFCNVNPPVHAWAAWNVYQNEKNIYGNADKDFLERILDKLNMNFTWWISNVDPSKGNGNIFGGGFLGLDNIRVVDKDPSGRDIEQADGTAWMALFCLNMMKIAGELNKHDIERKYLQHFIYICDALNRGGLWNQDAGFFFDCANEYGLLPVYSAVGLIPLFAIDNINQDIRNVDSALSFNTLNDMINWYKQKKPELIDENDNINIDKQKNIQTDTGELFECYLSIVDKIKLPKILEKMLDSSKFLSDYGIRSLAKDTDICWYGRSISYEPAESNKVKIMGGNSNWRGPIWFPINYLLIESLKKYSDYLGEKVEINDSLNGTKTIDLDDTADDISERLVSIFMKGSDGKRPVFGRQELFDREDWRDLILFYEYFHGDNGAGLGASHQTGWTGLVANIIQSLGIRRNK